MKISPQIIVLITLCVKGAAVIIRFGRHLGVIKDANFNLEF